MAHALVHGPTSPRGVAGARTARALAALGFSVTDASGLEPAAWADRLLRHSGPLWLLRAGAWPAEPFALPAPSRTGRPLCGLGAVLAEPSATAGPGTEEQDWCELLRRTGGELRRRWPRHVHSAWLEPALLMPLAARLARGTPFEAALQAAVRDTRARVVRVPGLDVRHDAALRVAQVVTSLQHGGAERLAIELAGALPRLGVSTRLLALGAPTRQAFAAPAGALDLGWERDGGRDARATRLGRHLVRNGIDVVHGHLLEQPDAGRLAASGPPLVLTLHNVRAGWPAGTERLRPGQAALLVACCLAAEADLRAAGLGVPTRTVWNGVDFEAFSPTPAREEAGRAWRTRLGLAASDLVLLSLANPRPQKRLERLPALLAATRSELARRGIVRQARLVLAGSPSLGSAEAAACADAVAAEVARLGLAPHVRDAGPVTDVPGLLAGCDVLVSTSAHEGLSLAQLEALALGLPVVATDAGGTREAADGNPAFRVLPLDAPPEAFADALADVAAERPASGRPRAERDFSIRRMAHGYARLLPRAAAARSRRREGLLLVSNNFSTGGAQSSARRLLLGLAASGVRVRAAVVEEQPLHPTPGRRALEAAGVPVLALPPPGEADPAVAVDAMLDALDADPPQAVLLWNVIPEHKLLLVDALLDVPVYDVSPGEMYFESLARCFAAPRGGLPYRSARDYGRRLAGVVVKYGAEAERAARELGAPVHVIPNGVPLGPPAAARGTTGPLVIGTLARLAPHKHLEDLLAAVRHADGALPPHVVRVAGGIERGADDYARALREAARGLAVEWVGEVGDAGPFLRQLDLFALISEPAGCPNASLEAMAEALPIVATDVGGTGEQIEDGVSGRLVPRRDPAALAEALVALARDPQGRARLGRAARARVAERFDARRMVSDYRRLCLDPAPGPRPTRTL